MSPLAEGVRLSVIGLTLVFIALGLLTLLLLVLQWVSNFLLDSEARRQAPAPAGDEAGGRKAQEEVALAAAIAVALVMARTTAARDQSLGDLLQRDAWSSPQAAAETR